MFNALNLGYLNGGGCGDGLFNMPDLGPQASAPGYVPHSILARAVSDEHIFSRQDITYPDLFLPVEDNWSAAMLHGQQDLVRTHPCNLWHCSTCTIHQHGRDAFRTSIDRTQASIYADDSEAWMQASYASTVLDTTPVPGPSSISPISSQTTSYAPYHFPGPTYNMGSGNLPTTIDPAITVAAANYSASRVTTIDPVPPPTLTNSFIPNGFTYSVMPNLPAHPETSTITCLAPRGYTIDDATLQHPRPKYAESGYDPIAYRHSGGQGMYSRRAQKRVYADSDTSEESACTHKRRRLLVLDTGKGQQTKPKNHRSIKFDGNSIEPDANSVSFLV